MKKILKYLVGKNISRAADDLGWSSVTLGEKSGTNQTTMNRLMRARPDDPSPRIDSIDYAIQALKLEPWAVMIESCTPEMMRNKRLTKLLIELNSCSPETRERIISNALDTLMLEKLKNNT